MSHPIPTMEYDDPATYEPFVFESNIENEAGNVDALLDQALIDLKNALADLKGNLLSVNESARGVCDTLGLTN